MNEKSPSEIAPELARFRHIVALKYALAGDPECADALETLALRQNAIKWNDPAFIKLSEEMRAGLPRLTAEQEAGLDPSVLALLFASNERLAMAHETLTASVQSTKAL